MFRYRECRKVLFRAPVILHHLAQHLLDVAMNDGTGRCHFQITQQTQYLLQDYW